MARASSPEQNGTHIDSVHGQKKYIAVIPRFLHHSRLTTRRRLKAFRKKKVCSEFVHTLVFVGGLSRGGGGALRYTWNSTATIT